MKNRHLEGLRRKARQYHSNQQWRLHKGVFLPHGYPADGRDELTWWDDVGFILNDRRVIVHWVHPRCAYRDAIESVARSEVPLPPASDPWDERGEKRYRPLGRSRKKVIGIEWDAATETWAEYFAVVQARENELFASGIDLDIRPSMRVTWYKWATAMDLTAPVELRSQAEAVTLAATARKLLKRETTVADEWPGYSYGRVDWLSEIAMMRRQDGKGIV